MNVRPLASSAEYERPERPEDVPAGRGPWRIGVVSNPLSGGNRRGGLDAIRRFLQSYPDIPHCEVRTAEEVQSALEDFARTDLNLIVVNSGDGTVQAALTTLFARPPFRSIPRLALMSGGTTNMTHKDLGLAGPPLAALQRLVSWAYHGDGQAAVRRRPVLRIETPTHPQPLFGMFFGAACIFKGIQFFHSSVRTMGLSGDPAHLVILARFLLALARQDDALVAPVAAAIRTNRLHVPAQDYLLLLITTLDRLILGLRPFWRAGGQGETLRLTALRAKPKGLIRALPALIRGWACPGVVPDNGYLNCNAREIRLDIEGGFAVDGELFAADPRKGPVVVRDGGMAEFVRV